MSISAPDRVIRSPRRTAWLTLGTAAGLAVLLVVGLLGWQLFGPDRVEEGRTEHRQPIGRVSVESNGGDVDVQAGPAGVVTVERRLRWTSLRRPSAQERVSGDTLTVRGECPDTGWKFGLGSECTVDLMLRVPAGTAVQVRTEAGSVRARDLTGEVGLTATAGDVTAENVAGPLRLHADSGEVTGAGLRSRQVDASINAGDLRLRFVEPPTAVTATADAGDVDIALAPGRYRVRAEADSGEESVAVEQDPAAAGTVTARSGAGAIRIGYAS